MLSHTLNYTRFVCFVDGVHQVIMIAVPCLFLAPPLILAILLYTTSISYYMGARPTQQTYDYLELLVTAKSQLNSLVTTVIFDRTLICFNARRHVSCTTLLSAVCHTLLHPHGLKNYPSVTCVDCLDCLCIFIEGERHACSL